MTSRGINDGLLQGLRHQLRQEGGLSPGGHDRPESESRLVLFENNTL